MTENILNKTFKFIDDIINNSKIDNDGFYQNVIKMMSSLYQNMSCAIFFMEDTDVILKAGIRQNIQIDDYKFSELQLKKIFSNQNKYFILKTKNDKLLFENTLFVKLSIKGSVFGFCTISSDNIISDNIISSFVGLVSILSYKIKDFEMNEVFKLQLRAFQDAFIEKENAMQIIKKQHKKLIELDKTKNLFLANISHDLRTPLNAIIGFSQALDSKIFGELNEKQSEYIKDIQISGLHLLGMINEILDISKIEAHAMKLTLSQISPKIIITEVIHILEPLFKNKNIKVNFKSDFDGKIKADCQKFQQILYNLLSNAIKFTPDDGKVEITSTFENKNYILVVKDTGIGIDKKYHNKIFKKFVHLDNSKKTELKIQNSTGLGLAITRELVKLHKAKIKLESEINKGTTFTVEFKDCIL